MACRPSGLATELRGHRNGRGLHPCKTFPSPPRYLYSKQSCLLSCPPVMGDLQGLVLLRRTRVLHKTVSRRIIKNLEGERGATKITLLPALPSPAGGGCSQHPKATYKCESRLHFLQAFQLRDEFVDFSCHFSVHFLWPKSRNSWLAFPAEAAPRHRAAPFYAPNWDSSSRKAMLQ